MMLIALKTEDGRIKGKIAFYCRILGVSRQRFYKYLANKDRPWKYQNLANRMRKICSEDKCNDTYGRIRMYHALLLKQREKICIPSEIYRQSIRRYEIRQSMDRAGEHCHDNVRYEKVCGYV